MKTAAVGKIVKTTTIESVKNGEETANNNNDVDNEVDDKNSGKSNDTKELIHTTVKTKLFVETTESIFKYEPTGEPFKKKENSVFIWGNTPIIIGICCGFLVIVINIGVILWHRK